MAQMPRFLYRRPGIANPARDIPARLATLSGHDKQMTADLPWLLYPGDAGIEMNARRRLFGLSHGERRLLQVVIDWSIVTLAGFFILRFDGQGHTAGQVLASLALMSVLLFFFGGALGTYEVEPLGRASYVAYKTAQMLVGSGVTYILIAWFAGGFMPVIRPHISEVLFASALLVPLLVARSFLGRLFARQRLRCRVAVVGANEDGYAMVQALSENQRGAYEFAGFFDDAPAKEPPDWVRTLPVSQLVTLHNTVGLDQIVLANPQPSESLVHTLSLCHERGVRITPMFALFQDVTLRVPVSHLGQHWYVALHANVKDTTRPYRLVKRLLDIVLALLGLLLVSPVLPFVMLAIMLDSPGPIFFKQVRLGLGGKPFQIVKFRSMRQDAEAATGATWAQNRDPRITRVGRFLRKSRLDEIPQLWNVLIGDMSFVGPRPERPEFDEQLERQIPFYRARRAVRPGLTGWAQVRHGYGNTLADALRKVEYDLYYIRNQSLYLDMLILLRTVAVVFRLRGT